MLCGDEFGVFTLPELLHREYILLFAISQLIYNEKIIASITYIYKETATEITKLKQIKYKMQFIITRNLLKTFFTKSAI